MKEGEERGRRERKVRVEGRELGRRCDGVMLHSPFQVSLVEQICVCTNKVSWMQRTSGGTFWGMFPPLIQGSDVYL